MNSFAHCPKCNSLNAEKMTFTWWGGIIGPKILTHVKCKACGATFNGKTGKDNTTNIVIYSVVFGLIIFVIFFGIAALAAFFVIMK